MSEMPIKDRSMLGTHGRKLCENIDVHWLTVAAGRPMLLMVLMVTRQIGYSIHCIQ